MKPTEWLRANKDNYATHKEIIEACMEATGSSFASCKTQLGRVRQQFKPVQPHPITLIPMQQTTSIGLSEVELRAKFDVYFIVRQAVEKLQKGIYLSEAEFVKINLRGLTGYRTAIDHPDLKSLIHGHESRQKMHSELSDHHLRRVEYWQAYLKELTAPGFKYKSRKIIVSGEKREPIIVPSNTWSEL